MPQRIEVISHWHHSVDTFNTSTLEFYDAIEQALTDKVTPVGYERVDYHESGLLSAKREYLRISHGRFSFDVGAAPFGNDYFFSWWLVRRQPDTSLMHGCLGLMILPILFVVLVHMAGAILGFLLFLVAIGGLGAWLVGAAQSGMGGVEDAILAVPVVSSLYTRFLKPATYYSEDTHTMFEETVHRVIVEHVTALLAVKGATALAPDEAKPQRGRAGR